MLWLEVNLYAAFFKLIKAKAIPYFVAVHKSTTMLEYTVFKIRKWFIRSEY